MATSTGPLRCEPASLLHQHNTHTLERDKLNDAVPTDQTCPRTHPLKKSFSNVLLIFRIKCKNLVQLAKL